VHVPGVLELGSGGGMTPLSEGASGAQDSVGSDESGSRLWVCPACGDTYVETAEERNDPAQNYAPLRCVNDDCTSVDGPFQVKLRKADA
jgi:hypothetical protein